MTDYIVDKQPCIDGISPGLTLVLSAFLFGIDRFYVGQVGWGIALLLGTISIVGLIIVIPIYFITQIALVVMILTGRTYCFAYGSGVVFQKPTIVDKAIALIFLVILFTALLTLVLTPVII